MNHAHRKRTHQVVPTALLPARPLKDQHVYDSPEELLATVLLLYKTAAPNTCSSSTVILMLKNMSRYLHAQEGGRPTDNISTVGSLLEQESARIASGLPYVVDKEFQLVNSLFHILVNLQHPEHSFEQSLELNAKAVFNVMIGLVMEGGQVQDCEHIIRLSIHLKDTNNAYPLRSLATTICIEMMAATALPQYSRVSIMKFILHSADYVFHHLESRITLSRVVSKMLEEEVYDNVEIRSLVKRFTNKLGILCSSTAAEKNKHRLYVYLEQIVANTVYYTQHKVLNSYFSPAEWSTVLDSDMVVHLYMIQFKYQMISFLEAIQILGVRFSSFQPSNVVRSIVEDIETDEMTIDLLMAIREMSDCSVASQAKESVIDSVFDQLLNVVLDYREEQSEIQNRITATVKRIRTKVSTHADYLTILQSVQLILEAIVVSPVRFVPRLMWMNSVIQSTVASLWSDPTSAMTPQSQDCLVKINTVCTDVYLAGICSRSAPRFIDSVFTDPEASVSGSPPLYRQDLEVCLAMFSILFSAQDHTWVSTSLSSGISDINLGADLASLFLQQLFGRLFPLLEKASQEAGSESTLIVACLTLEVLFLMLPAQALLQNRRGIERVVTNIADQLRGSALSLSRVWRILMQTKGDGTGLPFPSLQARLLAMSE